MQKLSQCGFTLIELMIVVTIVAILAAIALPAYQDYVIRSQVSEGVTLASGAKAAVWDFVSNTGRLPTNNISAGLALPAAIHGKFVDSVTITGGQVSAHFSKAAPQRANAAVDGLDLIYSPMIGGTMVSVRWTCLPSTVPEKYLPTICRIGTN